MLYYYDVISVGEEQDLPSFFFNFLLLFYFFFVKPPPYVSVCRLLKLPFFVIGILFPIFFLLVKFNCLKHLVTLFFTQCATLNDSKKNFGPVCLWFVKSFFFFLKNKENKNIRNMG